MAKIKWSNVLSATAIIGAAVAGGIILYEKYKSYQETLNDDFDDFEDDFEDDDLDFEDDEISTMPKREYVPINLDNEKKEPEINISEQSDTEKTEAEKSDLDEVNTDESNTDEAEV